MENKNNNGNSFLFGIILGGIIGAAVAYIMAPTDGKKAREVIKEKGGEILKKTSDKLEYINERKVKPRLNEIQKDLEEKFNSAKDDINKKIDELSKKASKPKTKKK